MILMLSEKKNQRSSVCSDGLHYIRIKKGLLNIRLHIMSIVHAGIILSIILTKILQHKRVELHFQYFYNEVFKVVFSICTNERRPSLSHGTKKSLVHARNYHKISCHTPSQPVENSPLCMNEKILILYRCPAHKNHHLSPKITKSRWWTRT